MTSRAARLRRLARLSRRTTLAVSAVAVAVCLVGLALLFQPRRVSRPISGSELAPGTVTVDGVELKKEARADAGTIATLVQGARVEVRNDDGRWLAVSTKAGAGFVPVETVERDADRQSRERRASTIFSFSPVSGVVAEDTDLRLAPFPLAPRAGRLERGTTVRVYSVDHDFYALRGPDGKLAFVDSARVDVIPPDPSQPAVTPAKERALKNLEVTDVTEPVPEAPGEEQVLLEQTPAPGIVPTPASTAGGDVVVAALLTRVDPTYPESARRAGVEGTVVLDVTIGADGKVTHVEVVKGLPLGLSEAAASAVKRWQYRPARGRGGPIVSHKEVRIEFRLHA